jgi:calcium-dependent protein kinase
MTEEKMWMMFKHFDVDDTDYISKDNITEAMAKLGKVITAEEIEKSIKTHDVKKDGQISFEEFKIMFQQNDEDSNESDGET